MTNRTRPKTLQAREGGQPLFRSIFLGGFECSTQLLRSGKRLDVVAASQHDRFCRLDYARLREVGIKTAREGLRWPRIQKSRGRYDFSSAVPMIEAAREHDIQILWDLCHFGVPDGVDIFSHAFVTDLQHYARAFVEWLAGKVAGTPMIAPINEISFLSWGAGDCGYLHPFARGRGFELKVQLVRAALAAMEAIWEVQPAARFLNIDPIIHIAAHLNRPDHRGPAEGHRRAQFQAWDMIAGRTWPQLGGQPAYLDIIGVNFYPDNQWIHEYGLIRRGHPQYRPLREMLREVHERYHRPIFISETGCEDTDRPDWLRYVVDEVLACIKGGVPIHGICLYPILNHPGWDDDRHCHNGLWDYADASGHREIYPPLAYALSECTRRLEEALSPTVPTPNSEVPVPA